MSSAAGDQGEGPPVEGLEILIVDDNEAIRRVLKRWIEYRTPHRVAAEATDGAAAIETLAAHNYPVVVMDVDMPKVRGPKATRIIKTRWPEIVVLGFSSVEDPVVAKEMLEAGADSYVNKSGSWQQFVLALEAAIARRALA